MSAISDPVIQVIQTIIDPLKIKALKKDVLEAISPYYNDNELKLDYIIYKCNEEKIKVQLNLNDVYFIYFSNYIVIHCVTFIIIILIRIPIMTHFLFQPDAIDSVKFKPIKTDLHQGVRKIVDDEIFYDFQLNTTQSITVGTDRDEVLEKLQRKFENQYNQYGKLKREDIKAIAYETMQAWKRLQRHIIHLSN